MKYTDRKKTPLKWHRTVLFLFQPLLILGVAWILYCMVNELFSLHLPFTQAIFTPILKSVNPSLSIHNLGSMFWPVTGTFFATILILILCVWVWIGFLKWKSSAKNIWMIYLLVRTVCLIGGVVYLITHSDVLNALQTFAAFDSLSRSLLHVIYALVIVICLWSLIFLILNFIYYHKRRLLFRSDYTQPAEETASASSDISRQTTDSENKESADQPAAEQEPSGTEEEKSSESVEKAAVTDENKSEKEESSEKGPVKDEQKGEETAEESDSEEEKVTEDERQASENTTEETEPVSVEPGEKQERSDSEETLPERNPNQVFCPYCGAKLGKYDVVYCSHCGRKIA